MNDDFRIRGRLEDATAANEFMPDPDGIGQVSVMSNRKTTEFQIGKQRLYVPQIGLSRRRVAGMTDGHIAFELLDDPFFAKNITDEADFAVGVKLPVAGRNDTRRFLSAML